jgi:hypothetical protein
MSKPNGSAPVFPEEDVKTYASSTRFLPKLLRMIFFRFGITNDGYMERYWKWWSSAHYGQPRKECHSQAGQIRNFIKGREKLTYNMVSGVLRAMGYEITEVRFTIIDRVTRETYEFSTNDSVDELKEQIAKENAVGIDSL